MDSGSILLSFTLLMSVLISLSSIDDAFIDVAALGIVRLGVPGLSPAVYESGLPRIAVFVANWHEEDVLGKMVEGNLRRITDPAVSLFLGVYPNDTGTLRIARDLEAKYPDRVQVIVNTLDGPTSKGQMLNEMFNQVFSRDDCPDIAVLHDSEDVIDPRTFRIYAEYARNGYDFIQVPVFSLNRGRNAHVASTYMDEFAERHTREMVVRNAVGAMIPSAGVGTALTKKLVRHFVRERGMVLLSGTVTEDYILGVEAKRAGFKSAFAAVSADETRGYDFVATREFFPRNLAASVKQKTRWIYGINFEAMRKLGWEGDFWDKYFFMRDRKGMITNFLPPISLTLLLLYAVGLLSVDAMPIEWEKIFHVSLVVNSITALMRYVIRVFANHQVYGEYDPIGVAVRWPVALYINMMAVFGAWKIFLGESNFGTTPIVWSKTAHELPEDFMAARR